MSLTDAKILITGASGSLGKQLIYAFDRLGIRPVVQVRESSDTAYIDSVRLEKRYADLRVDRDLHPLVHEVDAIIHAAAWVNFRQDRLTQFAGINTIGASNLFQAAQKAGVRRFVHISTVAAVGAIPRHRGQATVSRSASALVTETSEFNLDSFRIPYIITKHAAEMELSKLARQGETELVTVNPSIIVAPSRTGDDRSKADKAFSRLFMPDLANRVNLVDIRDVVPGIIAALERGRPGERYILAGDNMTVRDLVLAVSAILGKAPHLVRIPRPFLQSLSRFAVLWGKLLGKGKVSFYPDLVRLLDYDWVYSSMKARHELGYTYRPVNVTLKDLLENNMVGTHQKPG